VFLARVEVLEASGRAEAANEVRARGAARLIDVAAKITDAEWRDRFLRDVPANRALAGH
jgi:hypothetical protein